LVGRAPEMIGLMPCADREGSSSQKERRLGALTDMARFIKLTNWNFDNELDKGEWMFIVNIVGSMAGHGMAKTVLEDAFDYVSAGTGKISWSKVELLAALMDKLLKHAANLPTVIGSGNFTARDIMKFLVTRHSNELTRDEAKPFENVLAASSDVIKADMCLQAGFEKVDVNHNNVLQGRELDDPRFGAAVKESLGDFAIGIMKRSVNSIPKECQNGTSSFRRLGSTGLSSSLLPYKANDNERSIETSFAPLSSKYTGIGVTGLARILHESLQQEFRILQESAESNRFVEPHAEARMLSDLVDNETANQANQSNVFDMVHKSMTQATKDSLGSVKSTITQIMDWIDAANSVETMNYWATWFLKSFSGPRFNRALHFFAIVSYGSNILATIFAVDIVRRFMNRYRDLFQQFKLGKKEYKGNDLDLQNTHSVVTFLPAQVAFSIMFGWAIAFALSFTTLGIISVAWIYWEYTVEYIGPYVIYYAVYLGTFLFLKLVVIEQFIVARGTGEIQYPKLFSCLWIIFIVYNMMFGVTLAVYRILYMMIYAMISTCYVHYSIFPTSQVGWDPGYYCLLTAAYTSYERTNPIKNAFISMLMPATRTKYGPADPRGPGCCPEEVDEERSDKVPSSAEYRMLRARNRFHLALTLWRNPSLHQKRHSIKDEKPEQGYCCWGQDSVDGSDSEELVDPGKPLESVPLVKSFSSRSNELCSVPQSCAVNYPVTTVSYIQSPRNNVVHGPRAAQGM